MLDVDGLTVVRSGRKIVDRISFWVPAGEFLCLCGPNGAGKSTLLKTILGLLQPTSGSVRIHGKAAKQGRREVGYVPQRKTSDVLFPATVLDLIVANLRGAWPLVVRDDERATAKAALARVGGERLLDKQLASLSGGETQRAFLARALATEPLLLILDEPTAGVDAVGRAELIDLMAEISASEKLAAILVSHNLAAVARCAQRIAYLDSGRLVAWGLPSELLGRSSLSVLAFHADDHAHAPDED